MGEWPQKNRWIVLCHAALGETGGQLSLGGCLLPPGGVGVEVGLRVLGLGVMDKPEGWCVLYLMFSSMKLTMGRAVALI